MARVAQQRQPDWIMYKVSTRWPWASADCGGVRWGLFFQQTLMLTAQSFDQQRLGGLWGRACQACRACRAGQSWAAAVAVCLQLPARARPKAWPRQLICSGYTRALKKDVVLRWQLITLCEGEGNNNRCTFCWVEACLRVGRMSSVFVSILPNCGGLRTPAILTVQYAYRVISNQEEIHYY